MAPEPELEHCDVPADGSDRELPLPEQGPTPPAQRTLCRAIESPVALQAFPALEGERGTPGHRAGHAVDRTRVKPMSPKPDLQRRDATVGGEPAGSEHEDADGHRDADDGEATHAAVFVARAGRPSARGG
jgi:hypothetical protein